MSVSEREMKRFQQTVVKLMQEIETKKEEYNELYLKFEILDKEFVDVLTNMSTLKFEIADLERKFENLFSP